MWKGLWAGKGGGLSWNEVQSRTERFPRTQARVESSYQAIRLEKAYRMVCICTLRYYCIPLTTVRAAFPRKTFSPREDLGVGCSYGRERDTCVLHRPQIWRVSSCTLAARDQHDRTCQSWSFPFRERPYSSVRSVADVNVIYAACSPYLQGH